MTPSTVGALREAAAEAPLADPLRLIGSGGLVVIAPHPDDETFGASGLICAACDGGREVGLVALTDGEGSHRGSEAFSADKLATVRRGEQDAAMRALCRTAPYRTLRLSLPDGASQYHADFETSAERIAEFCDAVGASALVSTLPDDPHPDHHAAGRLALAVRALRPRLRLLFYPVWLDRLDDGTAIETTDVVPFRTPIDVDRKAAAIECHASQLGRVVQDDPDGFTLPDWFLARQDTPFERLFWATMPGALPGPDHFAALYANDGDPWHVRSAAYEADKRAATIACLENANFAFGIEVGCGEGHLTALLAQRCESMLGVDLDPTIIARAVERHGDRSALSFRQGRMPDDFPEGAFDLMVLSEVLYFLDEDGLRQLAAAADRAACARSTILLVNYLGATDTPLSGTDAADFFIASLGGRWRSRTSRPAPQYRIDHLTLA